MVHRRKEELRVAFTMASAGSVDPGLRSPSLSIHFRMARTDSPIVPPDRKS